MSEKNQNINNKRIAKNTILLYGRMLLLMIISLYTSRVILNALGVEDYGIYNIVGGVVSMFSILSGSLSAAISRFITFELGKENQKKLNKVFCTSVNVQIMLIVLITILLETVGIWFLNTKMTIPPERLTAAFGVFQISVITFAINLWSVPYNACIIAHEKMSAFAYISIFDALAKLVIAFIIMKNPFDRLIYYAFLVLVVGLMQRYMYAYYCKKHFTECRYHFTFDKETTKEIFGFAGWNFIGSSATVLRDQGGNLILNIFFGPTINAARGIAMQINSAVTGFVSNFMTALNPQITKSYALGDYEYMFKLVFQGARLSYYILLIMALPIMFTAPYLIELWLGVVPEHTSNFAILVLLFTLSECLAGSLITVMLAIGNIRKYQIIVGGCQLLNLPLSFFALKLGLPPESIFVIALMISVLCEFTRLVMLRSMIGLSARSFLKDVYLNVIVVTMFSSILPYTMVRYVGVDSFVKFIITALISIASVLFFIYTIGCNNQERKMIFDGFKKLKKKIKW